MRLVEPTTSEILYFVRESNAIENESTSSRDLIFASHFAVAIRVARSANSLQPMNPLSIHHLLMAPEPHKLPGEYRPPHDASLGGRVDREPLIPAHLVRTRMRDLLDRVSRGPGEKDLEAWIWGTHVEFERIHPFLDGNGRTGRLWMNSLRMQHGLPWMTIELENREEYFRSIREERLPSW